MRVLRAVQLEQPVLLEGSPGVGKTSLVAALAKVSGHNLVRINLSEQTVSFMQSVHTETGEMLKTLKLKKYKWIYFTSFLDTCLCL